MDDPQDTIVWHDEILGMAASNVPDLMANTNAVVTEFLNQNKTWANSALVTANATMAALAATGVLPNLDDPPDVPTLSVSTTLGGGLGPSDPPYLGTINTETVGPFSPDDIIIPDLTSQMPEYTTLIAGLVIPEPPPYQTMASPPAPGLDLTFNVGTAPEPDYGEPPELAAMTLPEYTPIILPVFNDAAPEFDTLPPDPLIPWVEPVYSSAVKDAIESVLEEMLAGGTGLPPLVEQGIWERGRQREDAGSLKLVTTAIDQWTSRGFSHPPGQLNGMTLAVMEESARKVNELSREVMVEQAKLEQTNRNFAVTAGITYEQVYVGLFMSIVDRNFQIAKFEVETAIQIFNMQVAVFNVEQAIFTQKTERFKAQLESALAPLKVFTALVEAEKAKAQMNESIVSAYKAKVDAYGKQVDAFKALVDAETARAGQQKLLVEIFKSQIDAMVSQVNLQRGTFEAYASRIQGETAKAGLEESNARVFGSRVQAYVSQVESSLKGAETQIAKNRLELDWQVANLTRISTLNGQQLNVIQANLAAYQAATSRESAEFSATTTIKQAEIQNLMEMGRLGLGKYQAMVETWKTRGLQILAVAQQQAESLRAAGTIASNLASGAMAGTHVSAGMSAAAGSSQSRTDNKAEHKTFTQGISNSYDTNINYNHNIEE